ncbi:MAG: hypothetical protein NZ518_11970, partial [Dehalococcoidia bacterium]|nr:hypothetical protein [Dehalococcoidia bacterium]
VIIPGFLALDAIVTRSASALRGAWRHWIVFAAVAAVTIAPLASYAILFPESFFQRQALLSPTNESRALLPEHETIPTRFVAYVRSVLGPGDPYLVHNVPGAPLISPWLAPLFVVGLALLLGRLRAANARFLLVWLAVVLSTAALPRDAAPNTMRVTGMLPALALVPALGMVWIVQQARRWRLVPIAASAAALLLGVVIVEAGWRHTTAWRASPALALTFDADMVDLASRMTDRGDEPGMAYLIALNPQYAPAYRHATIDFAYRGRAPFTWLRVDETTAPAAVAAAVGDHRTVQVFTRNQDRAAPPDHNELIGFLLRRQGALVAEEQAPWFRMQTYRLVEPIWPTLAPHGERPVDALFG